MDISVEELLLLENLTYIDDNFRKAIGKDLNLASYDSLGKLLDQFTPEVMDKLMQCGDQAVDGGLTSGYEWAAMIQSMKNNPNLYALKIDRESTAMHGGDAGKTKAICFVKPDGKAIVAFRGTLDENEWADNVYGMSAVDTRAQREALYYIESLKYDDITVIGHSKGGNKAQYVGILSDKVTAAISFDGQGFSKEFLETYSEEIRRNSGKVSCYSLSTDFVHGLLYALPGAQQYFVKPGRDVSSVGENHSPSAFFEFTVPNFFGELLGKFGVPLGVTLKEENGKPFFPYVSEEDPSMTMLHQFTTFVLNNASAEQKEELSQYLGGMLALFLKSVPEDQKDAHMKVCLEYINSNPEPLGTTIAYLLKYMEVNQVDGSKVAGMVDALFGNFFSGLLNTPLGAYLLNKLLDYMHGNLTDGKKNVLGQQVLQKLLDLLHIDINAAALWDSIESAYGQIGDIDPKNACAEGTIRSSHTMDYSRRNLDVMITAANLFRQSPVPDVSQWTDYASEPWYHELPVSRVIRSVGQFGEELEQRNLTYKGKFERVFSDIGAADAASAKAVSAACSEMQLTGRQLSVLANLIG